MRRGRMPIEPSSTLIFPSSTTWRMFAPLSSASTAEINTALFVRTISRTLGSLDLSSIPVFAGPPLRQIGKQPHLSPSARHGVKNEAAGDHQKCKQHQRARQDGSR